MTTEEAREPVDDRREATAWALAIWGSVIAVGMLLLVVAGRFLSAFRLRGDDFSLVLNSSWPYVNAGDIVRWFTEGYTNYFNNYPDWPTQGYGFVRPVMNLAFLLQSFLVPLAGERSYLIVNYLSLLAAVGLMVVLFRRYSNATPLVAGIAATAVGLSGVARRAVPAQHGHKRARPRVLRSDARGAGRPTGGSRRATDGGVRRAHGSCCSEP